MACTHQPLLASSSKAIHSSTYTWLAAWLPGWLPGWNREPSPPLTTNSSSPFFARWSLVTGLMSPGTTMPPRAAVATASRASNLPCPLAPGIAHSSPPYQRGLIMAFSSQAARRKQNRLPAAYYRGGTSRAVIFRAQDLPPAMDQWAAIFRGVIGSPDVYGRQLDGMGGGISSLSKACVVGPSTVGGAADVDYTFAAIGVRDDDVDYSSNCGNMSAAVGPFAVDSGMVEPRARDGECVVRIHNTNTGKIIRSTFPVADGEAAASGEFSIDGVAGTAPPVKLEFLEPAGSKTGQLLPTGNVADSWSDADLGSYQVTCVDVGNPCVFVEAGALVSPIPVEFTPKDIEEDKALMHRLERIRRAAGVRMGLAGKEEDVPGSVPKIAMVWKPRQFTAFGQHPPPPPERGDVCVRALSVGQPHKAVPVTVALSLAAAAQLPGTVVHKCRGTNEGRAGGLEVAHPSGSLKVDAEFNAQGNLVSAAVFRTARRLMEGTIFWK